MYKIINAETPAITQPVAEPTNPPAPEAAPSAPSRPCPQFFVLPASDQAPRAYRAGELVPNAYLDAKPEWVHCPWPDFAGVTARNAAMIVVIDDKGAVREVRPRGVANAAFQRALSAVRAWRVSPVPRYKGLPVWTSTAMDVPNDGAATSAATTPVTLPAAPASAPAGMPSSGSAQAPPPATETPFVVEYYYKVKWGFADEFWRLFEKNHWPLLRHQIGMGRILEVRAEKPVYHATEDGRWDYRVTIVFRSVAAAYANVDTPALERQLFPDQTTYRREEQRRFELLLAHWDVPLTSIPLGR